MARQRVYRTRAIVLKRRDMGEADRLIVVFTPSLGKRSYLARGVRKPASRKAGHLEPFTHVALLLAQGRTWDLITQAETVTGFHALREDLDRTAYAYYLAELVDAFTQEEDSQPELFDLLLEGLGILQDTDNLAIAMRWLELRLLRMGGYQPQFFSCVECGESIEPVTNYMSFEQGGVLCPRHGEGVRTAIPLSLGTLKVLRFVQTRSYTSVAGLQLSASRQRDVEGILAAYMRYVLERKLKSPAFIEALRPR